MIDRQEFTRVLKAEVVTLVDDLRVRASDVDEVRELVQAQWQAAFDAERTAHDVDVWREGLLAQVAVSWVLGCVFIRFCEDNGLVTQPMVSGPGDWRRWATDNQREFFREHTDAGERRYLTHVFEEAAKVPGLDEVFGAHNPLWQFGPSDDACRELLAIWRSTDVESNELVWDFADDDWNTRFLGDLYQDLSEHAKKTFALLQTPDFVEEFILDRTLDPAIEEFGLNGPDGEGFRMIDPACGSGHFLLGAFDRLANRWLDKDPAAGRRSAAAKALDSVFGVDINPFAASIARFRLLVAALRFAEVKTLAEAPVLNIHIAVGDSLLHGPIRNRLHGIFEADERQRIASAHLYETEDRVL
ncbi:BREX-2 system adenine-specific DNA-methyltransferase PglX, partial [Ilumatobacter sp.]|uniref:BREX-2 system adenine-specific DNA-methyltransferase PglX n=1 Tax=Ilumatobacter sp. TaxID=1967498 RepID=UPI003753A595